MIFSINPSTGEHIKNYEAFSDEKVLSIINQVSKEYNNWKIQSINKRSKVLHDIANALNEVASIGNAVHTIGYLPPATKGTHLAVNLTGQLDEANACTLSCNNSVGTVQPSGNVFAKQVIGVEGVTATSVVTAGTYAAPTSENLLITMAATNAKYGPGTQILFYAPKEGQWLVKFFPVQLGTGAVGTLTLS